VVVEKGSTQNYRRFAILSWLTLGYTVVVIVWGAFVRATGSGAGCGKHWPACNAQIVPRSPSLETMIEFSHRLSSGLALLLVLALVICAWRWFAKGHALRRASAWALLFILIEALIGAGLVLLGLVAENDSVARAVVIAIHLVNTFILLAALTYCAWFAQLKQSRPLQWRAPRKSLVYCGLGALLFLLVGASGAIVALGDTLFPASSLQEGWEAKFAAGAHFLVKLRWWHPLLAVGSIFYWVFLVQHLNAEATDRAQLQSGRALMVALLFQLALGLVNVLLLAPIWLQLSHLVLADAIWILICIFCMQALSLAKVDRSQL